MAVPDQDFYCDINLHFNTISRFLFEKDYAGSMLMAQSYYDSGIKRLKIYDGISAKAVLQENDILDEDNFVSNSDTKAPSQQSTKVYVDTLAAAIYADLLSTSNGEGASLIGIEDVGGYFTGANVEAALQELASDLAAVASALTIAGNIDASTNPNYPSATASQSYYITVAGKVGGASGKTVNIGDLVVCKTANGGGDEATVGTSWFVLESNRDQATEVILGVVMIAAQADVTTGTNDTKAITPLKLKQRLQAIGTVVQENSAITPSGTAAIQSLLTGVGGTITVTGDITSHLTAGCIIEVTGSTGNDGMYVVASSSFGGGNTSIVVEENVASAVADGNVVYGTKTVVTLTNVSLSSYGSHKIIDTTSKVEVSPSVAYTSSSTMTIWFKSPYTSNCSLIVHGLYANW